MRKLQDERQSDFYHDSVRGKQHFDYDVHLPSAAETSTATLTIVTELSATSGLSTFGTSTALVEGVTETIATILTSTAVVGM